MNEAIQTLIVEDDPDYRRLLEKMLSYCMSASFVVTSASRLSEALADMAEKRFDVVLLDLGLPDSQGLQTLRRLQKRARDLPIIVLTALDDAKVADQALQEGAQDYLVKGEGDESTLARAIRYAMERKAAEMVLRKREIEVAHLSRVGTVGQMASGLAHELNQPLGAILNYAAVCVEQAEARHDLPPLLLDSLRQIMNETRRAGGIVSRLRSFVRKHRPNAVPVDINALVEESIGLLRFELHHQGIRPRLLLADGEPKVMADPIHLEQVLVNLIYNALEAMGETKGSPKEITVQTHVNADGRTAQVSVIDNGPGIASENMSRLFEPFFTTKVQGLGMGLNISRTIIESHAGRLGAAANPGGGMNFHFTLPLSDPSSVGGISP